MELTCVYLDSENWPEWFTLDFDPGTETAGPRILVGIAPTVIPPFMKVLKNYLEAKECQKTLPLDEVDPYGFHQVFVPLDQVSAEFAWYGLTIPQVENVIGKCPECTNGISHTYQDTCIHCDGSGEEWQIDWHKTEGVGKFLSILSMMLLDTPRKNLLEGVSSKKMQLLSVLFHYGENCHIEATFAQPLGDHVRTLARSRLPEVADAMQGTYLQMFPSYKKYADGSFSAFVRDKGQIILNVPGSACGLSVDGMNRSLQEPSGPIKLDCHNVDGMAQLLALFAGVAAFTASSRKALYQ